MIEGASERQSRRFASGIRRRECVDTIVLIIEEEGFIGVAKRSAASTMLLLSRGKLSMKIFDGTTSSAQWLADRVAGATVTDIHAAIEEVSALA